MMLSDLILGKYRSPDFERLSDKFELRDGTVYWRSGPKAGTPAGTVRVYAPGSIRENGTQRKGRYDAVRVKVGKCVDPAAPRAAQTNQPVQLASVVWLLHTGHWPPPNMIVDHWNNDGACNHPSNLRVVTRSENSKHRVDYRQKRSQASA